MQSDVANGEAGRRHGGVIVEIELHVRLGVTSRKARCEAGITDGIGYGIGPGQGGDAASRCARLKSRAAGVEEADWQVERMQVEAYGESRETSVLRSQIADALGERDRQRQAIVRQPPEKDGQVGQVDMPGVAGWPP